MRLSAFQAVIGVLLTGVVLSLPAHAVEICVSDASDPDNDGWGWENNQSCHVGPYNPPTYPVCTSDASDTDRDGWGWENNQSCRSESLVVPGDDYDSAGLVLLGNKFGSSIGEGDYHFYKFEVDELTGVDVLSESESLGSLDYSIVSEIDGSYLDVYQFEDATCLSEGTYFFVVGSFDFETFAYEATLETTDLACEKPSVVVTAGEGQLSVGEDGSIYRVNNDFQTAMVAKLNSAGELLWETQVSQNIDFIEPLESGGILLFTGVDILFLDDLGNFVWSTEAILPFLEDYAVGGNTLVIAESFEKTIYALTLSTGALKWRYDYASSDFTEIMRVDDNGRVYLSTNDEILIFD